MCTLRGLARKLVENHDKQEICRRSHSVMINLSFASQIREDVPQKASKAALLGFLGNDDTAKLAMALEAGRYVCSVDTVYNIDKFVTLLY